MSTYLWVLYLHILSVIGLLTAHGIAIGAVLKLRRGNTPEEMRALLNLSRNSVGILHGSLLAVLITGVTLGFLGGWWNQLWIWTALVTLLIGWGVMNRLGTQYYDKARRSLGIETFYGPKGKQQGQTPTLSQSPASADGLVRSSRSLILMLLGGGGFLFLLWLMLFKPF